MLTAAKTGDCGATYGKDHLPQLLFGVGHYDHWNQLIPEVYGVSPAEFEAGWQAYMATTYDLGEIFLPDQNEKSASPSR